MLQIRCLLVSMYWLFVFTFFFNFWIIILVDRWCWLSGHNHLYIPLSHIIFYFFNFLQFDVCLFEFKCTSRVCFFFSPQTCVDSVGATICTFPVVTQQNVFIAASNYCAFLEKENFSFSKFHSKETMRLSSTHVMQMTWKQNKQSEANT